jgi:hypothetical protein
MKKIITLGKEFGISIASLGLPLLASAQAQPPGPGQQGEVLTNPGQFVVLICTAINWIFWFLLVLTVVFVLVAAYRYLTGAGNPEKIKLASNTLLYAAIAVIVALIAKGFPLLVSSFIGGGLVGTGC